MYRDTIGIFAQSKEKKKEGKKMENRTHFGSWDTAILLQIASHPLSCNEKEKKNSRKL